MTIDELQTLWEKHMDGEFLKFDRVQNKFSQRNDVHAFILLDKLVPDDNTDMVSAAVHDEIWLGIDVKDLLEVITEEQVIELVRCGVRWDSSINCLAMFV